MREQKKVDCGGAGAAETSHIAAAPAPPRRRRLTAARKQEAVLRVLRGEAVDLVARSLGADVATEVACWFQHPMVRGQGVVQRKPTFAAESTHDMLPVPIRLAVEIFGENIEDPIKMTDVADQVGVSPRQLERMFHKATGTTPLGYYRSLRMHIARQLLLYSKDSMIDIAIAVGYSSASALNKNYIEVFGIHPRDDRNKINMFRVRKNATVPSA